VGAASAPGCDECALADENQYQVEPSLTPGVVALQAGADVSFEWSALDTDVFGRPLVGVEGNAAAWLVSSHSLSVAELVDGMVRESLDQAALTLFVTCLKDEPNCRLSEFRLLDGAADVPQRFATAEESWGLVIVNPADGGIAGAVEVVPAGAEAPEAVEVATAARVTYASDLAETEPLVVRAGEPALRMDWTGVSVESLGGTMGPGSADTLFVVHTALSPAELDAHVYDLAAVATQRWTMPLGHTTTADLSELTGSESFAGITAEGTWLLGLECGGCTTPAPRLLTVLEAAN
jgi:hypothetical protein